MTGSVVTTGTANMLQLDIAADTTLATPLILPTGFATGDRRVEGDRDARR